MNPKQPPTSNPNAARVILCDTPAHISPDPRIIHAVKVSDTTERDAAAYARGICETISFENGFIQLPQDDSIRETLPNLPQ